jgi:tetratricopeptide (TPR) repeat protein
MTILTRTFLSTLFLLLLSGPAISEDALPVVTLQQQSLQQEWDHANFEIVDKKLKAKALEELSVQARLAATRFPSDVAVQTWAGIILSTYAGEAGMSALSLVKEAKNYFEKAIALDANGLNGSAYTSLGSLYYQVPGWPVSFGDDDKAETFLKKGLFLNPEDIDANYFYADFLVSQKDFKNAATYYEKVLAAAPREGRSSADKGRKAQAQEALARVSKKIK